MLVIGDVHGDDPSRRRRFRETLRATDQGPVIQTGDLHTYDAPRDVWFVAGNHEDFDVIDALRDGTAGDSADRVHLIDGAVVLDGLRVAGLSGNHAPTQYQKDREDLEGDRRRHFTAQEVDRVKRLDDVDVFVAHEAPHGVLTMDGYDVGCRPIDEILQALEPSLCLVGHHHTDATGRFGPTTVRILDPFWKAVYQLSPEDLSLDRVLVDDVA